MALNAATATLYSSWPALQEIWEARDARYRRRPEPLSDDEIASIRADRLAETELVPVRERLEARRAYNRWQPPGKTETDGGVRFYRRPFGL